MPLGLAVDAIGERLKDEISQGRLVLTDGGSFELDINEFGAKS